MLGGSSSMWCVTVRVVSPGRFAQRTLERLEKQLSSAEVEPRGGLVEGEQRGIG